MKRSEYEAKKQELLDTIRAKEDELDKLRKSFEANSVKSLAEKYEGKYLLAFARKYAGTKPVITNPSNFKIYYVKKVQGTTYTGFRIIADVWEIDYGDVLDGDFYCKVTFDLDSSDEFLDFGIFDVIEKSEAVKMIKTLKDRVSKNFPNPGEV